MLIFEGPQRGPKKICDKPIRRYGMSHAVRSGAYHSRLCTGTYTEMEVWRMGAKRVTQNNARASRKNGRALLAKHLDGPDGKAARMGGLLKVWRHGIGTWKKGQPMETDEARMCEGVEAAYYKKHFSASLDAQNEKHRKSRHKERIRSLEDYIRHPDTCPESTLFYVGNMDDTASASEVWKVFVEFWKWRKEAYPQVVSLDAALHKEEGAPHVHERHVWIAHDKEGREIVSQTKALEEMGVPRPDEAKYRADMAAARKIKDKAEREKAVKKAGLHNNAKMTYTATCRAKLIELAKAHGFEIIETPKEPGESGLSQARYKARDEERKAEAAKQKAAKAEADLVSLTGAIITAERDLGDLTEFRTWKRDKAAQEAQEAARKEREEQEARGRQEAARAAQAAQERERQEQAARAVRLAAQEAARPKTPEERYLEAQAAIWGGTPAQTATPELPKLSAMERLKQMRRDTETAARDARADGPGYPGA